jgi:DNA (cytosine-5)-methyltransferase 1
MGAGKTVEAWDEWTAKMRAKHGNGNGHGPSLSIEAQRLLPTPTASDTNGAGAHGDGGADLRTTVALMGTPRSVLWKAGTMEATREGIGRNGYSARLEEDVALLPTPTSMDSKASGGSTPSDVTLTDAVVRTSLGATTNPRFAAGKPSPDVLPLDPPSEDVPESA